MNEKLLLVGGGGHCRSVLDSLSEMGRYAEIGIVDKAENAGKHVLGIAVIGCDDDLSDLYEKGFTHAFVTLGSTGNVETRVRIFKILENIGFEIPNIVDSTAIVSKHAKLASGIFIGKNAVVNAGASIGKGAIINTSVTVDHDCGIGEFAHIATGAVLCGRVQVGKHTHIGAGSVIKQQVRIGAGTIIGMGSVVLDDVTENVVAYGNPCREVRAR